MDNNQLILEKLPASISGADNSPSNYTIYGGATSASLSGGTRIIYKYLNMYK